MPAIGFLEYVRSVRAVIEDLTDAGDAVLVSLRFDQRSSFRGFVEGSLQFRDGSQLIFREYLDTSRGEPRLMYAYHYQDASQQLVFRYDNAVHRPTLSDAMHKHTPSGIEAASPPALMVVLDEILHILGSQNSAEREGGLGS